MRAFSQIDFGFDQQSWNDLCIDLSTIRLINCLMNRLPYDLFEATITMQLHAIGFHYFIVRISNEFPSNIILLLCYCSKRFVSLDSSLPNEDLKRMNSNFVGSLFSSGLSILALFC